MAVAGGYFDDHQCISHSEPGSVSHASRMGFCGDGQRESDFHQGPNRWSASCRAVLASAACGSQFHHHRQQTPVVSIRISS